MFSLTLREQFLVIGVLAAAVVGAGVAHWRDVRREVPHAAPTTPPSAQLLTPSP